jgi:hypothetical protein
MTVGGGAKHFSFRMPFLNRSTPSAASHTYGYTVSVDFLDNTNTLVNCTGTWFGSVYIVAQENKK